jgi:predicted AlkP superfamily pyrophosphatase or phosphodiesterase
MKKVILISIDGMRPDGLARCGHPFAEEVRKLGSWTQDAHTVFPSVTLPCHMSLFHSIPPERHGMTTNVYMPPVRPVKGLFEQVKSAKKKAAMFYGWEPLRDVARPESLKFAEFIYAYTEESADTSLTDSALARIQKSKPDFVFLYMVDTDEKGGHDNVWMSEEYLRRVSIAVDNIRRVIESCGDEYTVVITADHGGHDRTHGTDMPEDTTIPMFYVGKDFPAGQRFSGGSILDIAPTVAKLMGAFPAPEWEGKALI